MTSSVTASSSTDYPPLFNRIIDLTTKEMPMSLIGCKIYSKPNHSLPSYQKRNLSKTQIELLSELSIAIKADHTVNEENNSKQMCYALLFLSLGALDECHNIVTPLSISSQSKMNSYQNACYIHAITHRKEGQFIGEFGSGWINAQYWFSQSGRHDSIFEDIAKYAYDIVYGQHKKTDDENENKIQEITFKNNSCIVSFLQSITVSSNAAKLKWNPYLFVKMCEECVEKHLLMSEKNVNKKVKKDVKEVMMYCEKIVIAEWKLLLKNCYCFK